MNPIVRSEIQRELEMAKVNILYIGRDFDFTGPNDENLTNANLDSVVEDTQKLLGHLHALKTLVGFRRGGD